MMEAVATEEAYRRYRDSQAQQRWVETIRHPKPETDVSAAKRKLVDTAGRTVTRDGQPIALTFKEFELLRLLVSRRGTVLTRDEILSSVWDYDFVGKSRMRWLWRRVLIRRCRCLSAPGC